MSVTDLKPCSLEEQYPNGHDIDIETKDKQGWTPLHAASLNGHMPTMEVLLGLGAKVEAKDRIGQTPLMCASKGGHIDAMEILLSHGAEINAKSNRGRHNGETALIVAIKFRRIGAVEVLLRHGPSTRVDSLNSSTVSLIPAIRNWDIGAVEEWLRRRKDIDDSYPGVLAPVDTLWQWVVRNKEYHFLNLLLIRNGVEILEARDHHGRTPLLWASQNGYHQVMEVLLRQGAQQLDAKDRYGMTALALACQRGHVEAVKVLLDHGACPHVKNRSDWNPLDYAFLYENSSPGRTWEDSMNRLSTIHLLLRSIFTKMH